MKKIVLLLFVVMAAIASSAQNASYTLTRQLRFYPIVTAADTAATMGNIGRVWFDFGSSKFRCNKTGSNTDFGSGTGSMLLTGVQTSTGKKTFLSDATNAGLNFGSVSSNPSSLVSGDAWYNSATKAFYGVNNGIAFPFLQSGLVNNSIPYHASTATGLLNASSGFTFDGTILSTPAITVSNAPSNDNALTQVLVRDGSTGVIKYRSSSSLGFVNPMTTLGDIIYEDATPTGVRLAGNTTTTKKFLTQTGNGSISAVPSWSTIVAGDVPTLNQNTTGNAATVTTNANLTGDVTSSGNATTYSGIVPIAKGGTATPTPALVAGTNISITGTWPNNTINSTASSQWTTTGSDIYYNTGNVMIGNNSAPSSKLHIVETSTSTPRGILVDQYNTGTNGARITMRKARGTYASPITIVTGDVLASWTASGYDGAAFIESGKILSTSTGTLGTSIVPSKMELQTANSSGSLVTGLSIDQSQQLTFPGYSTNGGIHYNNGSGVVSQTGAGTSTTVLHGGTSPAYSAVSISTDVSGLGTGVATLLAGNTNVSPTELNNVDGTTSPVQTQIDAKENALVTHIIETSNRTLVLTDKDKNILMRSVTNQTVTVPTFSSVAFLEGTRITFVKDSTNTTLTFIAASGVSIESSSGLLTVSYQDGPVVLEKKNSSNSWFLWNGAVPIVGAALTKTDDTNVTLTLGGNPTASLLAATSLTLGWTGNLSATRGGTGLTSFTQGDIIYASATNTLLALAKNASSTRYLSNTGSSNNPAWAQIDLSNGVTGDLPFANLTQGSARSVLGVTGNSTADVASIQGTANQVLRVNSAGTAVAFGDVETTLLHGTATNDNATAGYVGEEIAAIQSTYTNFTTTATYQNITSITLTAGDWDLSSFFTYSSNSATITAASNAIFVISTTTASASGATEGKNIVYVPQAALLGTSLFSDSITPYRISISGSTTYYLNAQATFTIGNPQFVGSLRARRIR